MLATMEDIPALVGIVKVWKEINDLVNPEVSELDIPAGETAPAPVQFWIAGGAITSAISGAKINDYDIFSSNPQELKRRLQEAIGYNTFEHEFFTNFWVEGKKVQVITRYEPKDPEATFATFDLTISCGAYDGTTFYCHDRFWQDMATQRLVVINVFWPLKTMERIAKYSRRGYRACPHGLLAIAKSIHGMEIDWDNPSQNDLAFYPDGTPRFNGPD